MKAEELLQQLAPWREACKRLDWKPMTEAGDGGLAASKFAGMPWLVEDESYPCCGNCHAPMPNEHLPYMFGDMGRGHLTQCPEHHEVLTFAWAGS